MQIKKAALSVAFATVFLAGCARETADQQNLNATQQPALTPVAPARVSNGLNSTATERGVLTERSDVVARRTVEDDAPRYVVKKRSKKKSAAIIGGSAAAGAGIGALAGGGKGAGIGAIIGGVGGAVYDRTTAKKKERID